MSPKEKRTKPCSNCKKSKVKCIYTDNLPCERCVKMGSAMNCQFVPKLPSLNLPLLTGDGGLLPQRVAQPVAIPQSQRTQSHPLPHQNSHVHPHPPQAHVHPHPPQAHLHPQSLQTHVVQTAPLMSIRAEETGWKNQIESKVSSLDSKLNELVDILKTNHQLYPPHTWYQQVPLHQPYLHHQQQQQQQQQQQPQQHIPLNMPQHLPQIGQHFQSLPLTRSQSPHISLNSQAPLQYPLLPNSLPHLPPTGSQSNAPNHKRMSTSTIRPDISKKPRLSSATVTSDFRNTLLSKSEATTLFLFFNENISQQLFGFELSKFPVDVIWESSPILICAICTISSIHHPDTTLSSKLSSLKEYLHELCGQLIYMGRPKSELEGFNTIVALILCSFWLLDSQMFTGLALQIAKEIGLNSINSTRTEKNGLNKKDKLKLWYLLYVLDGQQSLTFNRQPLVDANDYTLKNVRGLLLHAPTKEIKNKESNVEKEEIGIKQSNTTISTVSSSEMASNGGFTDLRLISQVEYNQALNAAFNGNAWDLLSPASFGMPSKSNLELDKWMVSWTVLLSPVSNGAVWSSKSTLIYYNFAKMHINSSSVRNLQTSSTTDGMLPKWESSSKIEQLDDVNNRTDVEIDSEDESDDEDEFISNKELVSENQTIVNANIAVNAASTVLNLVVNDNDILNNLKYVPVHIHIMLYYAALLLVNPPLESNNKLITVTQEQFCEKILANLKTVKKLQKKIYMNLPTDKKFGNRLIKSLENILDEKLDSMKKEIESNIEMDKDKKRELLQEIAIFVELNEAEDNKSAEQDYSDSDQILSRTATPGPEKISAWPGSHHGHP